MFGFNQHDLDFFPWAKLAPFGCSTERFSAGAAILRVWIFEGEARSLQGDHEVDRRAREVFVALVVDEDAHAVALDHGVVGVDLIDETQHVFITGTAARLDHDAEAVDRLVGPGDRVAYRVQRTVGQIDHCSPSLLGRLRNELARLMPRLKSLMIKPFLVFPCRLCDACQVSYRAAFCRRHGQAETEGPRSIPRNIAQRSNTSRVGGTFRWWQYLATSFANPLMSRPDAAGKVPTRASRSPPSTASPNCPVMTVHIFRRAASSGGTNLISAMQRETIASSISSMRLVVRKSRPLKYSKTRRKTPTTAFIVISSCRRLI